MTTQPDQNQPAPAPIDYDPMTDRANPASWVQSNTGGGGQSADAKNNAEELKGEALEKALEDAGLPKYGTADEKRQRLAEYRGQ